MEGLSVCRLHGVGPGFGKFGEVMVDCSEMMHSVGVGEGSLRTKFVVADQGDTGREDCDDGHEVSQSWQLNGSGVRETE